MEEHRNPRPRVSERSAAGNHAPRPTKRALLTVEESLGELRQLIAKTAASVYAVDDLFEKILWDDRTDERDEDRRNEHLSLLIETTRETVSAAVEANVRALLRMLRVKLGGSNWLNVERALPIAHSTLAEIIAERVEVSTTVAFRVAKILDVSLHHVLTGEALPPGTCKHCGMPADG